jgi:hypothetical protein
VLDKQIVQAVYEYVQQKGAGTTNKDELGQTALVQQ